MKNMLSHFEVMGLYQQLSGIIRQTLGRKEGCSLDPELPLSSARQAYSGMLPSGSFPCFDEPQRPSFPPPQLLQPLYPKPLEILQTNTFNTFVKFEDSSQSSCRYIQEFRNKNITFGQKLGFQGQKLRPPKLHNLEEIPKKYQFFLVLS